MIAAYFSKKKLYIAAQFMKNLTFWTYWLPRALRCVLLVFSHCELQLTGQKIFIKFIILCGIFIAMWRWVITWTRFPFPLCSSARLFRAASGPAEQYNPLYLIWFNGRPFWKKERKEVWTKNFSSLNLVFTLMVAQSLGVLCAKINRHDNDAAPQHGR